MQRAELEKWIDAALDGSISEADFVRLEAELLVSSRARQEYYRRAQLTVLLEETAIERVAPSTASQSWWNRGKLRQAAWWVAAAAVLLGLIGVSQMIPPPTAPADRQAARLGASNGDPAVPSARRRAADGDAAETAVTGYGVLAHQVGAVWRGDVRLTDGSLIPVHPLRLERGLAQIDLFSGVSLVVEGAAEFAVLSPMEVVVQSGRVRARVPQPAHGFRITTDVGEVVDLGTEFAVDVSDGKSEVHVLDGEVEWRPRGGQAQRVLGGQAVGRSDTGDSIEAPTREFVGIEQLRDLVRDARSNRLAEWREQSRLYRDDPRMLLYYQVMPEDVAGRRIPNLAGQGAASDGAVVAAMPSPDRWGQPAGAIDFSPAGSRVRVTVPGVHRSLTLLCWVKINSLDRWYNSLFLTDGHEQGEPHWQIMDDGRLFFSVKKRDVFDLSKGERDKHIYYSPPFWTPELSGRWLMIATVYDPDAMQVTHYLNGEVLSTEAIPQEYLVEEVRIGNASLCNWGLPERNQPRFAVRNLNGSLDEFMLFGAALSAEEIQQIYEFSRP